MRVIDFIFLLLSMIMLRSASSFAFSGRSLLAISQSSSTRFEVAARRCSSSSASMQIRTATTKRRMATLAALFTVTSATALAAGPSKNNEHHLGWNLKSATDTALCEGEKSTKNAHDQILPESILKYDHYNGVIIHLDWLFNQTTATTINGAVNGDDQSEVDDREQLQQLKQEWEQSPDIFETLLKNSLQKWKQEGRKGIWVHVPRNMAAVVPACIKLGFDFHSCHSKSQINAGAKTGTTNLILSTWLPMDTVSRLPLGPYFQAGVGCVVLHPSDPSKMLVVQEITGPAAARKLWKMPTGLIDPGEDIAEAALRELEEETGIHDATCQGILAFRQAHGASAGRASSDLFFVCLLTVPSQQSPEGTNSIDNLSPQEHEIADIKWMPVKDYAGQDLWQKSPVYLDLNQAILDCSKNRQEGKPIPIVAARKLQVGFTNGTNTVYRSHL